MMKALKISLIVLGSLIGIAIAAAFVYRAFYAQKIAQPFEVNSPDLPAKILIATQGSAFKTQLVAELVERIKSSTYIRVIDVSGLSGINESDWKALVVINTCEGGKMQTDVATFLAKNADKHNIVLLTTSGSGEWKPTDSSVDSISSASKKDRIPTLVAEITQRIEALL
ncbi:putative secreted protein [Candidatus Moduliflexus flocculans]|uniref:Putative secreted protein n=1 Tax=Candidatus Moduliflexus flocculans TaxID=1499966 RepID=A0A0S6VZ64_9BACT|nr:putative secreted protein [Candidatus Moduliflexus flocculans]